jgi:hypothetical protein
MRTKLLVTALAALVVTASAGAASAAPSDRAAEIASNTLGTKVQQFRGPVSSHGVTVRSVSGASRTLTANVNDGAEDGTAVVAVLDSRSQVSFDLGLPAGATLEEQPDGAVVVAGKGSGSAVSVEAVVKAPWAKDATGKSLPTRYEVQGNRLIQNIDTTRATYPIVADPWITGWGWYGCCTPVAYVQWSLRESRGLYTKYAHEGVAAAALYACSKIPNAVAVAACLGVVAWKYADFKAAIQLAHDRDDCLKARVPALSLPTGSGFWEAVNALDFYVKTC